MKTFKEHLTEEEHRYHIMAEYRRGGPFDHAHKGPTETTHHEYNWHGEPHPFSTDAIGAKKHIHAHPDHAKLKADGWKLHTFQLSDKHDPNQAKALEAARQKIGRKD